MQRASILATLVVLSVGVTSAGARETRTVHGQVLYVLAAQAYLSFGSDEGVAVDTEVEVLAGGRVIAHLAVESVSPHTAVARFVDRSRAPRPGDKVRAAVHAAVVEKQEYGSVPTPTLTDPGVWSKATEGGYPKVHFDATGEPLAALRPMRASAYLRNTGWVYFDATKNGNYEREQVDLVVSGPVDAAGRFVVDADLTATAQLAGPNGGRFRDDRSYWLDVYRAALWFRGVEGLGLGVGRLPSSGLRYGLVDGAFADYQLKDGPKLELAVGFRPNSESMTPALDRPTASVGVEGDTLLSWGLVTYGAAVAWLGRDHSKTEGAEASASLGLDLSRRLWLGAELGGVAVVPASGGSTRTLLDRAAVTATLKVGDETTLRLAGRRLDEPSLDSDAALLPTGYLPGALTYDALLGVDSTLGQVGPIVLDLSLSGGGVIEPKGNHNMSWGSPGLVLRLPGGKQLHARVAYHLDYGWVTDHLGEIGVGLSPTEALTFDVMQQAGVILTNGRHEQLTVGTTWASLAYHFLERFELSVRGRGIYGEAGRGLEVMLLLGGRDLI